MPKLTSRLTDTIATHCPAPDKGYVIFWCSTTPGFGVRVTHEGVRAWILERRLKGRTIRRTLGRVSGSGRNAVSAEDARDLAVERSGELVRGKDVSAELRAAAKSVKTAGITFADALQRYVADDSARDRPLKDRTRRDYLDMIRPETPKAPGRRFRAAGELASIVDKRLDRLTGAAIKALYQSLQQQRGPTRAAYAVRVLRGTLNYQGVQLLDDPFDRKQAGRSRIKLPRANRRERIIPQERLAAWWKVASAVPDGDYFQLLLLTGLRGGELSAMKIADVDVIGGRVVIADPKNRRPHTVQLSSQAQEIVERRVGTRGPQELLFDHGAGPRGSLAAIVQQSGVSFSAHDCRRTHASIAASLLPGYVVQKLLNHSAGNDVTAGHYVHLDETTLRAGWQKVADFIMSRPALVVVRKVA
jgi:integrase